MTAGRRFGGLLLAASLVWIGAGVSGEHGAGRASTGGQAFGATIRQEEETAQDLEELDRLEMDLRRGRTSVVLTALESYRTDFPKSVRAGILLARTHRARGELEKATAEWRRWDAAADDPRYARELGLLGHLLLLENGRRSEAAQPLDRALAAVPNDPALLARRVEWAYARGRRDEARQSFDRLPKIAPGEDADPSVMLEIARALRAMNVSQPADRYAVFAEALFRRNKDPRQAEALYVLGEIYRIARFEDGVPALEAYHLALEIDPTLVECHLGEAKVHLYRQRYDRAEEALAEGQKLRPDLADLAAIDAELQLVDRNFSAGLEVAERTLAKDPEHEESLGCRAAALVLLSDPRAEAAVEAMRAVDPADADGMRRIGDLLAFHYRFTDSIPWYERGLKIDPAWSVCFVGLARSLANTGRTEEAIDALEKFRRIDQDRYPLAHNLRKSLRAVEGFVEVSRPPFTFALHPLDAPVLGPILEELYDTEWPDLCRRYSLDPDRDVRVEVFPVHDDFSARSVGFAGFGALGVCFGDVFTLVSPRSELRGTFHFQRTAVHELTHVVSLALSRHRVPRWLTEGMSVYEERVYAPYCDREMDQELLDYHASGEILPLRDFNKAFQGPKILFGYYQGGLLCEYVVEHHGAKALVDLLRAYADDLETPEAIERVFECSPEEFDQRFLRWIEEEKLAGLRVQPNYTPEGRTRLRDRIESSAEPAVEDLVQMAWAYHRARRRVDRDDFVHRALQRAPEEPSLLFLLGEIAFERNDVAEGRRLYERAFEKGGDEFYACLRMAELEESSHRLEPTLEFLGRAKRCFPRYVGPANPYLRRAEILSQLGRQDEVLEELRQYCAIQESDPGPRAMLARAALEREDYAEAERYLLEIRSIDPFQRQLFRDLARCQRALARPSDALRSLDLADRVDPSAEAGFTTKDKSTEELEAEARRLHGEVALDRAEILLDVEEWTEAKRALDSARECGIGGERWDRANERLPERTP